MGIFLETDRKIKSKTSRVQQPICRTVTDGKVVRGVLFCGGRKDSQRGRIKAYNRINIVQLSLTIAYQCGGSAGRRRRAILRHHIHYPLPHAGKRNHTHLSALLGLAVRLIAVEEKQFVFDDRSPDSAANRMADECGPW